MDNESKEGKRFCVVANLNGFHNFDIGDEVECVDDADGSDYKNYRRISDNMCQWVCDNDLIEIVETYAEPEESHNG